MHWELRVTRDKQLFNKQQAATVSKWYIHTGFKTIRSEQLYGRLVITLNWVGCESFLGGGVYQNRGVQLGNWW